MISFLIVANGVHLKFQIQKYKKYQNYKIVIKFELFSYKNLYLTLNKLKEQNYSIKFIFNRTPTNFPKKSKENQKFQTLKWRNFSRIQNKGQKIKNYFAAMIYQSSIILLWIIIRIQENMYTYTSSSVYYYYPHNQFPYYQPPIMMPMFEQPINFYILPQNYAEQTNRNLNGNQPNSQIEEQKVEQNPATVKSQPEVDPGNKINSKKKELKELATSKKNGESNIINRFFTFFQNQERSKPILSQIINKVNLKPNQTQEKSIQTFYVIIALISNNQKRTYVNRKNIIDLTVPSKLTNRLSGLWREFEQEIQVSLDTLSSIFRLCIHIFIKKWSLLSILNSRRISTTAKKEYLRRRRQIEKQIQNEVNLGKSEWKNI